MLNLAPMTLALYDPSTDSKLPYTPSAPRGVSCVAIAGAPALLTQVRQAVVDELVLRVVGARVLGAELAALLTQAAHDAYEPEVVRYWALSLHYRDEGGSGSGLEADACAACEPRVVELAATVHRLRTLPPGRIVPVQTAPPSVLAAFPDVLRATLEDDLDTPAALVATEAFVRAVNALCDAALSKKGRVNASAVAAAEVGFAALEALLGLGFARPEAWLRRVRERHARQRGIDTAAVEAHIARRASLRAAGDFAAADQVQAELLANGVRLHDGPSGTSWSLALA